jgi:catechol 2,3-dioxygenase-like lactoylglutathione lyase family enzyme
MTDWFGRPVLHVADVETSLRFYVNRLGFTSPWRHEEDGQSALLQLSGRDCIWQDCLTGRHQSTNLFFAVSGPPTFFDRPFARDQ